MRRIITSLSTGVLSDHLNEEAELQNWLHNTIPIRDQDAMIG